LRKRDGGEATKTRTKKRFGKGKGRGGGLPGQGNRFLQTGFGQKLETGKKKRTKLKSAEGKSSIGNVTNIGKGKGNPKTDGSVKTSVGGPGLNNAGQKRKGTTPLARRGKQNASLWQRGRRKVGAKATLVFEEALRRSGQSIIAREKKMIRGCPRPLHSPGAKGSFLNYHVGRSKTAGAENGRSI